MGRAPCCEKEGVKRGPWTPEEDHKLIHYIHKHGPANWRTLPKNAGLQRCGKSCRLRWTNYLRPDIKRGRFSFEEEETIIHLHSILGNKWSAIASRLPGRTDNEIKNYWNTHIKKRLLRMGIDPVTHSPRLDLLDLSSILNHQSAIPASARFLGLQQLVNPEILKLASSLFSTSSKTPTTTQQQHPNLFSMQNQQSINQNPSNSSTHNHQNLLLQTSHIQNPLIYELDPNDIMSFNQVYESNTAINVGFEDQSHALSQLMNSWQSTDSTAAAASSNHLSNLDLIKHDCYLAGYNGVYGSDNSTFQSNNQSFSMLSTQSSCPTPLNSNSISTDITTEDEKESYCSNLMKFDIPSEFLDANINGFM